MAGVLLPVTKRPDPPLISKLGYMLAERACLRANYFQIMIMASFRLISWKTNPHFQEPSLHYSHPNTRKSAPSPKTPPATPNTHPNTHTHTPQVDRFTHTYQSTPDAPRPAPLADHFKGRCYQPEGRPAGANPSRDPDCSHLIPNQKTKNSN